LSEVKATKVIYDTPPVNNYLFYWWRIFAKIMSFALFGIGTVMISIVAFPVMRILFWGNRRFKKAARRFINIMFKFFGIFMACLGAATFTSKYRKELKNLKGCIVIANHPSLLDVVFLISMIPHADCIVNASLSGKNIVHVITRTLYVSNNLPHEELMKRCKESIDSGNVMIIFPEGTRSLPSGMNPFKKGAARVALFVKCPVVPVFLGGNDKVGLRKHDSMFKFNPRESYRYRAYLKETINPEDYKDLPEPAAAKRMTARMQEILCYENNRENMTGIVEVPVTEEASGRC